MAEHYKEARLSNGIQVVTERMPDVRSVSIGIWVGTGSRFERDEIAGVSHVIEHLLFKGTKHRTAKQIAEAIDSVGGQLNAFTGKEYTCFYCKVLDEHVNLGIELLSDMMLNSLFDPQDIEKEKAVIQEEIRMYQDTPDELIHDLLARTAWNGHPLGRPILGSIETVARMTSDQILEYLSAHYVPERIVIAAAGNLDHEALCEALDESFKGLNGAWQGDVGQEAPNLNNDVLVVRRDTEQVHLCLGARGLPMGDDRFYALQVLNNILGGTSSSRLFQKVREERGLAYSVFSYQTAYKDTGLFSIYAGVSPSLLNEVLLLVHEELKNARDHGFSLEELHRGKEQLKGSMVLGLESTSNRMSRLGKLQLMLGYVPDINEAISKIEAVSLEDIESISEFLLEKNQMAVAVIGAVDEKEVEDFWRQLG